MNCFDEKLPEDVRMLLEKHKELLNNAFLGESLYWRCDLGEPLPGPNRARTLRLLAHRNSPEGPCIAAIPLEDLVTVDDEEELAMKIITGSYQPKLNSL